MTAREFARFRRAHLPWWRRIAIGEAINAALFAAVVMIVLLVAQELLHGAVMPDLVYGPR